MIVVLIDCLLLKEIIDLVWIVQFKKGGGNVFELGSRLVKVEGIF